MLFVERWVFNMFLPLWFWVYLLFVLTTVDMVYFANLSVAYYLIFATSETLLWLIVLYYSNNRTRDARCFWILPILPFYQLMQRCVTSWALLEEMLTRRSFSDSFVPAHVRRTTWKW